MNRSTSFIRCGLCIVLQERDNKRTCCLPVDLHTLHRVAAFQHIMYMHDRLESAVEYAGAQRYQYDYKQTRCE